MEEFGSVILTLLKMEEFGSVILTLLKMEEFGSVILTLLILFYNWTKCHLVDSFIGLLYLC